MMKTKRFLFVSSVVLLAALCIGIMNLQYDRLSRYPYQDPQARALIDEYLSDEEISYIIEYSIAPSEFIQYLGLPGFSIYHISFYQQVRDSIWYLNNENIVYIVELAREKMSMEQLIHYLLNYDFVSVVRYLKDGDHYHPSSVLVDNPNNLNAIVDDQHTLSSRILYNAIAIASLPSTTSDPVIASDAVVEPFKSMCIAIESELDNGKTCGGLMVQAGYLTYEQQVELYESNPEALEGDISGHSEHQLGTAFDFVVKEVDQSQFVDTVQYQWLSENGHRFGFIQSYPEGKEHVTQKQARPWHWRYVGYEKAADLYFNQLTLFEAAYE